MNKKLLGLVALVAFGGALTSCDTDVEKIDVQKPYKYSELYYQNLRDYKKSDHEIAYAYYAWWHPLEGVEGSKDPASMAERIAGLPDSIDIVNLWMGVPTPETHPVAYRDMVESQKKRGIRFVMHADASHYRHKFTVDGVDYDMGGSSDVSDEVMDAYARWIRQQVDGAGLDGVDIDYEGWNQTNILRLVKLLGEHYGPMGSNPEKLLIVDYFGSSPSSDCEPYCDYFVQQAYSDQTGFLSLNGNYPPEKQIFCEQFGNGLGAYGGKILQYAAWEPSTGRKGGCGAYYIDFNYMSTSGVPYGEYRQAIQIMNPAVH